MMRGALFAAFAGLIFLVLGAAAGAQEATSVPAVAPPAEATAASAPAAYDDPEWEGLAARTETALQAGRASSFVFETLRDELVTWRSQFSTLQSANSERILTLEQQIKALGPVPEDASADPERIIAERDLLQQRLATLQTPVRLASEAHTQADRLIAEIDTIVRQRWTESLLERQMSPLNPAGWSQTWGRLVGAARAFGNESYSEWTNEVRRAALWDNLDVLLFFAVAALVLLWLGKRWARWVSDRISARTKRGRGIVSLLLSLGQVILPMLGVSALSVALQNSGMLGLRGQRLAEVLPAVAFYIVIARWLVSQLLHDREGRSTILTVNDEASTSMGRAIILLGWLMGIGIFLREFADVSGLEAGPRGILLFPVGVIIALLLWRLGRVLRNLAPEGESDPDAPRPYRFVLAGVMGRTLSVVALAGIALGALGYVVAFERLISPMVGTLFLLGVLILLQGLVFDLYSLLTRSEDGATEALVPVLIGFVLFLGALPLVALIWGARVSDLSEIWTSFREGFQIGSTRISPTDFLTFAVVFSLGYFSTRLIQGALRSTVLPKTKLDVGGQNAIVSGFGYIGIFLAALVAITTAGIDLSGLAIVAGALSVGIGFGLQNIVSNFVSGIILLIERPISQGDWIEVNGNMGYVRDISVRSTRIETFDRTDVIVPNADLVSGTVTNYTRGNTVGRVIVPVGVAYGTDTKRVAALLQEIAEGHPMVLLTPPPAVHFIGFGADSLDFEIRGILRDVNWVMSVKTDINHEIARRFTEEGIEIPFAQRDVWLRNPEALTPGKPTPPEGEDT